MEVHTFLLHPCLPTPQGSSIQPWFSAGWCVPGSWCQLFIVRLPIAAHRKMSTFAEVDQSPF